MSLKAKSGGGERVEAREGTQASEFHQRALKSPGAPTQKLEEGKGLRVLVIQCLRLYLSPLAPEDEDPDAMLT